MSFSGPAEDRLAIRELIETYADAVTRNDGDVWTSTWAEDSKWSLPDGSGHIVTVQGRTAIAAFWTEAMKQFPGIVFQAWPGAIMVEAARATVRSYTCETYENAAGAIMVRGTYDDECVMQDGRWLFRRRAFTLLASTSA